MPRSRGDKEYILPINGLNTESNLLHFPQEFAVDVLNMESDYNPQMVRPRKGIATQSTAVLVETRNTSDHDIAIHSFLWENVNDDADTNLIVVQVGRYIYFFDDTTYAANAKRIDLNTVLSGTVEGTVSLAEKERVDFANVKGNLVMCGNAINPTLIRLTGSTIEATALILQQRDLLGIDDGLEVDERPSTLSDDHKYNLYNQGWYLNRRTASGSTATSSPITNFEVVYSNTYPSNADIVYLGMVEDDGDLIFDAEWLHDQTFGSTPAAKGHYIVDIFNLDRDTPLSSPQASTSGGTFHGSVPWGALRSLVVLLNNP